MAKFILLIAIAVGLYYWWKHTPSSHKMRPDEARLLLGLSDNANAEDIRAAHRRIIARVHPDAGGSDELARKINAARDVLLADLSAISN